VTIYLFPPRMAARFPEAVPTMEAVAEGTDTADLVAALYLLPGLRQNRGVTHADGWETSASFVARRGKWAFAARYRIPQDLPVRFKLIRMRLDDDRSRFPRTERDVYHWEFRFGSFSDRLAFLFAHELHHYRRHHLGLDPRGGEHAANRWALALVRRRGFQVEGRLLPIRRKKRTHARRWLGGLPRPDPYAAFRALSTGHGLVVKHDPGNRYTGQPVTLLRKARAGAKRVLVKTPDGEKWRWPMEWLQIR
jgi:hypothetical protein